jgi:CRISPR/Cas system-associated endonuclease Cas1
MQRPMEIDGLQHPDFIWTWKSSRRAGKVSLWLPYLQSIERLPKGKSDRYRFSFNGGEVTCHLKEVDFLMLYGASGALPVEFLDKLSTYRIPLIIHRRNLPRPYVFFPQSTDAALDVLSHQIRYRDNLIRRAYIARTLIRARIGHLGQSIPISHRVIKDLQGARSIEVVRSIEATATKRYWDRYYQSVGLEDLTRREKKHPINAALDAGSFFMFGVLLRWLLFHRLSPCHAFLHEPTTYPSLCYDLMEPYRGWIEDCAAAAIRQFPEGDTSTITAMTLQYLKAKLEQEVYVPQTRQTVARKNLLHGIVLALRAYLLGETTRLVVPMEGPRAGGRPPKLSFKLPGRA